MNRRDFLKRGAIGAAAAVVASVPVTKAVVKDSFPVTKEDMCALVEAAKESGEFQHRLEGAFIPEGLSMTDTMVSRHWYYHKGSRIAVLHTREADNHVCFSLEDMVVDREEVSQLPSPKWHQNISEPNYVK